MEIREKRELLEKDTLSKFAVCSVDSKGRVRDEEKCSIRTNFQRDRDRIIHCKAFRRLEHKTQVFISPEGDHYRTRLTHTLEVSQIARTVARGLNLNEDLVEAISLGHDLGHTPFGHSGEHTLNKICPYGFKHYEQSLRVVEVLEDLNLTFEVKDGIVNHTGTNMASTLEGQIVKFADRIAYINHDIDDAMRGGIISEDSIPAQVNKILGNRHSKRISTLILSLINASYETGKIQMETQIQSAMMELRDYMFHNVYIGSSAKKEEDKAMKIVEFLYDFYLKNPDNLPENTDISDVDRAVCDYIAGMTDRFAIRKFNEHFIPRFWSVL